MTVHKLTTAFTIQGLSVRENIFGRMTFIISLIQNVFNELYMEIIDEKNYTESFVISSKKIKIKCQQKF